MLQALAQARLFLTRRQKLGWLLLVPLSLGTAAFEALAAGAVFFLIRWIDDPAATAATLPASLREQLAGQDTERLVPFIAVSVAALFLVKNLFRLLDIWAGNRRAQGAAMSLARRILAAYLAAPWTFHLQRGSMPLIHNVLVASRNFSRNVLQPLTAVVSDGLIVLGMLGVLLLSTPGLALVLGTGVALLSLGLLRLTQNIQVRRGVQADRAGKELIRSLNHGLGGVKELRLLGRSAFFEGIFARSRLALARIDAMQDTLNVTPRLVLETILVTSMVAALIGAHLTGEGDLLARLGLFTYAALRILPSLHWIISNTNRMRFGAASLHALQADWLALGAAAAGAPAPRNDEPLAFGREIELANVSFVHPGTARPALDDVSVCIRQGESIGIVGATGAGKSTLVDLVLGLLEPSQGSIRVDGHALRDSLASWQRQIGYVAQSPFLIDDTLARNIALGLDDAEIDETRVRAAARMAQLDGFLANLPDGLDTRVGERGLQISGGERQRVAVARALYHDPQILVFDEATSALDAATELDLSRAIEGLQGEKTLIIVAHRMTSVRHCDRLIMLAEGRIVDVGSYEELMERSETFRSLARVA